MLDEGSNAVDFNLQGSDGKMHNLDEFKGKYIVLYFYPKDNTPGCTIEARTFNEHLKEIEDLNGVVIGVSKDKLDSHEKFKSKLGLDFLLLSDPDSEIIKKYDVYGKRFTGFGTIRSTYIMKDGKILKAYPRVKPSENPKEVIEFLKEAQSKG